MKESWRKRADQDIAVDMRKMVAGIPGAKITVVPNRGFGGISAPIQVELLGEDLEQLREAAEDCRRRLSSVPGVINTDISLRPGKPERSL